MGTWGLYHYWLESSSHTSSCSLYSNLLHRYLWKAELVVKVLLCLCTLQTSGLTYLSFNTSTCLSQSTTFSFLSTIFLTAVILFIYLFIFSLGLWLFRRYYFSPLNAPPNSCSLRWTATIVPWGPCRISLHSPPKVNFHRCITDAAIKIREAVLTD